jgi:hypothetical protein
LYKLNPVAAVELILGQQDSATGAWTSSWNDLMTACPAGRALQYLMPYCGEQEDEVNEAIQAGLIILPGPNNE